MLEKELEYFLQDKQFGSQSLRCIIHTATKDIDAFRILSFDVVSDFVGAYTDQVIVKVMLQPNDGINHVLPRRSNLEMTVIKTTTNEQYLMRYKAVVPDAQLKDMQYHRSRGYTAEELDKTGLVTLEFHGRHLFSEFFSIPNVSGTYSGVTVDTVLSKCVKHYMQSVSSARGTVLDECIISTVNNQRTYPQLTIPAGTPILQLPHFLQERFGLYPSALGSYLRPFEDGKKVWWVYPQYGNIEWNKTPIGLRILVPQSKSKLVLRNSIQRIENTTVIVARLVNDSPPDNRPVIRPTGIRVIDSERCVESPSVYKDKQVTVSGTDRFKELDVYTRADGLSTSVGKPVTSSNYYAAAAIATASKIEPIMVRWDMSISELITPGMVVHILFDKDTYVEEGIGRVSAIHSISAPGNTDTVNPIFQETSILQINMEKFQ